MVKMGSIINTNLTVTTKMEDESTTDTLSTAAKVAGLRAIMLMIKIRESQREVSEVEVAMKDYV